MMGGDTIDPTATSVIHQPEGLDDDDDDDDDDDVMVKLDVTRAARTITGKAANKNEPIMSFGPVGCLQSFVMEMMDLSALLLSSLL